MHKLKVLLTAVLLVGFVSAPALADQPAFDRSVVASQDKEVDARADDVMYGGGLASGSAMPSGGPAPVAEPGSLLLIGLGLLALVGRTRRR